MVIVSTWKQIFSAMENLWQKEDEKGFTTVLHLLCGIAVIGWLSGCVYLLGNNESKMINSLHTKIEIQLFCEECLKNTSRMIDNKYISMSEIEKSGKVPVYTVSENKMTCNVYAVKDNDDIILLGEGNNNEVIVRMYLHLIWQEDTKKWIPLYYEA